ncbi:XIAP-associated factor 1 isoform X1 [Mesocricetus auratus]|uniref:XIAP-associated factor 1 isoform X1 n=1 Tax=Mesocricetus auratus TaxID=10036 RepID=A0A3Q0CLB6_MESAU|nr:XIAP-associated factor 1 isoform X1 [Mesocricetus auratus]
MEADFQVCSNCKRNVASVHFTLHEAHCLRFLVICPECEEPIPKSEMKEHAATVHQQTKEIQQHPARCKFCDLAVHFCKLDVHESHCGLRTESCPHCNQPIPLQALARHKDVCLRTKARPEEVSFSDLSRKNKSQGWGVRAAEKRERKPWGVINMKNFFYMPGKRNVSPERKTRCDYCKQMIPENKYVSHMKQCPASRTVKYLQDGKPKILPPSRASQVTGNQTSTVMTDVRPKTKIRNSSTSGETKDKNGLMGLPLKPALQPRAALPKGDETAYDIFRKCCWCSILLPLPILNQHQEKCLKLAHRENK